MVGEGPPSTFFCFFLAVTSAGKNRGWSASADHDNTMEDPPSADPHTRVESQIATREPALTARVRSS